MTTLVSTSKQRIERTLEAAKRIKHLSKKGLGSILDLKSKCRYYFIHSVIFSCTFVCEATIILLFVYKIIQCLQALTIMIGRAPVRHHEPQNSSAWRRILYTDGIFQAWSAKYTGTVRFLH